MKKKVIIEKVPTKSSKKKVVIEGLPKADPGMLVGANQTNETDENTGNYYQGAPDVSEYGKRRMEAFLAQNPDLLETTDEYGNKIKTGDRESFMQKVEGQVPFKTGIYEIAPSKQIQQKQKKIRKPSNVNYKMGFPHIGTFGGNKYYQEAAMLANDALQLASNIGKDPKDIVIPPPNYNRYVNMYYGAEGGYLPKYWPGGLTDIYGNDVDESGNVLGVAGVDQYGNPISKRPLQQLDESGNPVGTNFSQPLFNMETGSFQGTEDKSSTGQGGNKLSNIASGIAAGAKSLHSAYKGVEGYLYDKGIKQANDAAKKYEAQLQASTFASTYAPPYETQGYGFLGRNSLAADGMQIREIGGKGEPNVEVEGDEHIQLPNGFSQEIKGKKHSEGGIPMNLPQGTKIFSEKLKVPVKFLMELIQINPEYAFLKNISLPKSGNISYADLAKKFETKKYVDLLNSKDADPIQITTAQLMIQQNNAALEKLFTLQEQNKLSGVHGPQVQQNAEQEYQEQQAQEAQQQSQEQMEEPMMMHGGLHKAQNGKEVTLPNGKKVTAVKVKEPGKDYKPVPNMPGYYYRTITTTTPGTPGKAGVPPQKITKFMTNEQWKEYLKKETPEQKERRLKREQGIPAVPATPDIVKENEDYVYIEPEQQPGTPPAPQVINKTIEMPGMNLGIGLPNIYQRLPLNYYKIEPNYVEAPIEQPYTYDIDRAMRAGITNATDLSGAGIADRLQAFSSGIGEKGKRYYDASTRNLENKFRADMANAQAKSQADQYNQQSWYQQLEDPIRRRESIIGDQELTDYYRGLERMGEALAYDLTKDYISRTFPYYQNMSGQQVDDYLSITNPRFMQLLASSEKKKGKKKDDDETTTGKNGGKVRIKPKLKRKY